MSKLILEEQCLLDCFTGTSRVEFITDMEHKLPYLDKEVGALTRQTIKKLKSMTDDEFDSISLLGEV